MELQDAQIEARFAQHEERMRKYESELAELRKAVDALRTALEGDERLGIIGIVKMVRDTYETVNKAKWIIAGATLAGSSLGAVIGRALGS